MLGAQPETFAKAEQEGRAIAGTPAQVTEFLCDAVEKSGVNYIVGQFAFGRMPHEFTARSIGLFAEHVMPRVREFASRRPSAVNM